MSAAPRHLRAVEAWGPPLAITGTCLVLAGAGGPVGDLLAFDRAGVAAGQWWRLYTANFVHLGWYHLVLNLAALWLMVLLCPQPPPLRAWGARLLVLCPAVTVGLYLFAPGWERYVGLSGVLHGMFVLALLPSAINRDRISTVVLACVLGKVLWEWSAGGTTADELALGGAVVTEAHRFGVLAALVYAVAAAAVSRRI